MNVKRAVNPSRVDEFVINDDVIVSISYRRGKSFGFQIKCKPEVTGIKLQIDSGQAIFVEEIMIGLFDYAADNLAAAVQGFTSISKAEY
jgi:hypothetical protein